MSPDRPLLVVFAGPNGSGKSSLIRIAAQQTVLPNLYINADDMARDIAAKQGLDINALPKEQYNKINLEAANHADQLRQKALDEGKSFATETVMSTPAKIDLMREAKAKGYNVELRYITTQDPDINIKRVQERVQKGGHDVPPEKTQARYERALRLLPLAVQVADIARVYNNSFENPKLILEKTNDRQINIYPQNPPNNQSKWTQEKLEEIKAQIIKIDHTQSLLQGPGINELPKQSNAKALFGAYAKDVLLENGQTWDNNTNRNITQKLLQNGFSVERTKDILKHSPEPLRDICGFVRGVAKTTEISKTKGLER